MTIFSFSMVVMYFAIEIRGPVAYIFIGINRSYNSTWSNSSGKLLQSKHKIRKLKKKEKQIKQIIAEIWSLKQAENKNWQLLIKSVGVLLDSKMNRFLSSDFCVNLPKAGLRVEIIFHCMQQICCYYTFWENMYVVVRLCPRSWKFTFYFIFKHLFTESK